MRFKRDQEVESASIGELSRPGSRLRVPHRHVFKGHVGIVLFKRLDTNENTNNFAEYQQMGVNNYEGWISENASICGYF